MFVVQIYSVLFYIEKVSIKHFKVYKVCIQKIVNIFLNFLNTDLKLLKSCISFSQSLEQILLI